jgi:hypothetical protein
LNQDHGPNRHRLCFNRLGNVSASACGPLNCRPLPRGPLPASFPCLASRLMRSLSRRSGYQTTLMVTPVFDTTSQNDCAASCRSSNRHYQLSALSSQLSAHNSQLTAHDESNDIPPRISETTRRFVKSDSLEKCGKLGAKVGSNLGHRIRSAGAELHDSKTHFACVGRC